MAEILLIQNGTVINPYTDTTERKDVFISGGKIADASPAAKVINAEDCYVAPGFIDMHVHIFEGKTSLGINADKIGVEQGVTSVVDAGSTGIDDFSIFKTDVIEKSCTEVLYFLNVSRKGLCHDLSELANMNDLITEAELAAFIKKEKGIMGLKVRMSSSVLKGNGIKPLRYARQLSDKFSLPLMVHIGNPPPPLGDILNLLKKGDIVTHVFHGKAGGILDYLSEYKAALKRGVLFDVGHGTASFSKNAAQKILSQCRPDYTISTDLYNQNYEKPVSSLMLTMSKFISMGFTLEEVVKKVTKLPREALGIATPPTLLVSSPADITIFKMSEQPVMAVDSEGLEFKLEKQVLPHITIRNGKRVD